MWCVGHLQARLLRQEALHVCLDGCAALPAGIAARLRALSSGPGRDQAA
jgi:hypothetical protein